MRNDRLRIAAMCLQGLLANSQLTTQDKQTYIDHAFQMADRLIAGATSVTIGDTERLATLEDIEHEAISKTIRACKGNRKKAAAILGIGQRTLYRKLKQIEDKRKDG